ncbi:glutathione-dependent formaldehyde-activating [Stemphylium lycopersici]|uniref:Glutathione-dependent formaldehyde-activating n=1 Tax=Stemphylium lycopersici TaxID=183478 RepID=A0A364MV40_STELY|nr:glutathione-dependent formaldehyde-activating protein [Stemphylium lycopersici]RAR01779.1 glutathione-dependent formaldehyde-activating [Stemphylium lycopersici]RAR04438.1 glutathione-dependent formaldehyde-activating [Stemphylium lycopersici]
MPAGGCICGNVRYEVTGEAEGNILCHCLDCRKITGSTYSSNQIYPDNAFKVTQGTPKQHKKKGDTGNEVISNFCGDCGSTMWREGASFAGKRVVKASSAVGTLDDTSILDNFKTNAELYADLRPKWIGAQEGAAQKKTMS